MLGETGSLIVAKHGVPAETQAAYVAKILSASQTPTFRHHAAGGTRPLRKLSRNDRFISPAARRLSGLDRSA